MSLAQKLQRNPLVFLCAGFLLVLGAVGLLWSSMMGGATRDKTSMVEARVTPVEASDILVAARDIRRGHMIKAGDIFTRRVEKKTPESIGDASMALGRIALADIAVGQIILTGDVGRSKAEAGLSAIVPEGARAVSIRVAEEEIVSGFLRVGDRVDVYASLPGSVYAQGVSAKGRQQDQSKSILLLQNLQVLAIGEKLDTPGANPVPARTVTLALDPDSAARLSLAKRLGQLTLAVRNPMDADTSTSVQATLSDLVPEKPQSATQKEAGKPRSGHRITVYAGPGVSVLSTSN